MANRPGNQPRRDNQEMASNLALQGMEYTKRAAFLVNEADKELWSIVSDVPRLTGVWPYICAILNVVLPGAGTMLASCVADTTSWSKTQIFVGVLQMLTAIYLIGWVWSIWWSYLILAKAMQDKQEVNDFLSKTKAKTQP